MLCTQLHLHTFVLLAISLKVAAISATSLLFIYLSGIHLTCYEYVVVGLRRIVVPRPPAATFWIRKLLYLWQLSGARVLLKWSFLDLRLVFKKSLEHF